MNIDFSRDEMDRYSRNILLAEVGGTGQARLRAARVLVVGAGGLGSPLLLYLAAAGVGTLGIVDDDTVALSNLQRQVAHTTARVGQTKVASAAMALTDLNPAVRIEPHPVRLSPANAMAIMRGYDLVCDGSDNFSTRFLVADACHLASIPVVSGAVLRFDGQLSTFRPGGPCYRCLYPTPPPAGLVPTCGEAGILGAVTGVIGTLMATEVLKELMGIGTTMAGRVLIWDALAARTRVIALPHDPACALCGAHATIRDLSAHG